jgi:hypothetical protein
LAETKYKETIDKYGQNYQEKNQVELNEKKKQYYYDNKEVILRKKYKRVRHKLASDPIYRMTEALRSRVRSAVKNQNGRKAYKTMTLVGCSIPDLRKHLESKFTKGMSWKNYGYGDNKWHIDHVLPCISFDLSKETEQLKCFHYSNLQPLWQLDNFSKGGKVYPILYTCSGHKCLVHVINTGGTGSSIQSLFSLSHQRFLAFSVLGRDNVAVNFFSVILVITPPKSRVEQLWLTLP